jgi:two-component system, OmpR family, phosphate regulon sensor histidine kinase PhoR
MATEPLRQSATATSDGGARRARISWLTVFLICFSSFLVMIAVAAYAIAHNVENFWRNALQQELTRNLTEKAQMFAGRIEADHATPIADMVSEEGLRSGARATVIDANGKVVADSQAPAVSLENEGALPEFRAALRGEIGTKMRASNHIVVLYVAVPVGGGAVRLAYPMADFEIAKHESERLLLLGCLVSVVAALVISSFTARTVTRR